MLRKAATIRNDADSGVRYQTARSILALVLLAGACSGVSSKCYGFAYNAIQNDQIVATDPGPIPITWQTDQVIVTFAFSDPNQRNDGRAAAATWNQVGAEIRLSTGSAVADVCDLGNSINTADMRADMCGKTFGDILGVTLIQTLSIGGRDQLVDADIAINSFAERPTWQWLTQAEIAGNTPFTADSLCTQFRNQTVQCDFYRVILHELGHALGLAHPDEVGQTQFAVMNSGVVNTKTPFSPQSDDIAGLLFLYPSATAGPIQPSPTPAPTSGGGGGGWSDATMLALLAAACLRRRQIRHERDHVAN